MCSGRRDPWPTLPPPRRRRPLQPHSPTPSPAAAAMLSTLTLEASMYLAGATTVFAAALLACLLVVRCCGLDEGRLPDVLEVAAVVLTCMAAAAACGPPAAVFIGLAVGVAWWRLPVLDALAAADHDGVRCCCACTCGARPGASKAAGDGKPELSAAESAV